MRAELVVKGRSLTGTSDLTLVAPLLPGFVPSLDATTYKTRVKRLMKVLQGGRTSLHEYAAYRPLSDAVERVAAIHSFRVVVMEPQDEVMLAVTFDGTWESYIRILWQKVGTLLDIIFCNTEGYVVSHTAGFEAWAGWVRRVQVETGFYYHTHGLTVPDAAYLRAIDTIHRTPGTSRNRELKAVRHSVQSAESIAWDASHQTTPGSLETLRQGLQALAVLFRLTDSYLPGTRDGDILKRAARDLLVEFRDLAYHESLPVELARLMRRRFERQLAWLDSDDGGTPEPPRPVPALPDRPATDMLATVQAGILVPYGGITHGALLLIAVDDPLSGALLLDRLLPMLTTEAHKPADGGLVANVAFTHEGLRALGLDEPQLSLFPQEFREGMEARASMLGDFRSNHPRRWRLPRQNWPTAAADAPTIEMSTVHAVVQLRIGADTAEADPAHDDHPLKPAILALMQHPDGRPVAGVRLLHVQPMQRHLVDRQIVEHFGFADGMSDPVFDRASAGRRWRNQVHLGEFLIGRHNMADTAAPPATPQERERLAWQKDGSFLVVRKLRQHVERLNKVLSDAAAGTGLSRRLLMEKLMGRDIQGRSRAHPDHPRQGADNDFNYQSDPDGSACPIHSHVRRANPRPPDADQVVYGPPPRAGGRLPRLLRRGMSYGPRYQPVAGDDTRDDQAERGLVFMAYNASIAEQFEVVQRWLSGGNSSGGHSRQSDPFCGVPEIGEQRTFCFEHGGRPYRVALDAAPALDGTPAPLVSLEWGLYLFAPALPAVRKLRATAAAVQRPAPTWSVDDGQARIEQLRALEQHEGDAAAMLAWKAALEDPEAQEKFHSAGIWAAVRARHGGALRTPYGVLVADGELVSQVLLDVPGFTVAGYKERMQPSIGEIYLGLDGEDDGRYEQQSLATNAAIGAITMEEAFDLALRYSRTALGAFVGVEQELARQRGLGSWELNLDAKEVIDFVLARLCQEWFGLPAAANDYIVPGSWRWDWREDQPPIYPAHFTAPSRYIFQPWPNAQVADYGQRIGAALTAAIARFTAMHRAARSVPQTPDETQRQPPGPAPKDARIAKAILEAFPARGPATDALVARTFCGALMGMLPTIDGNVRLSLNEWLRDGTFWSLRAAWDRRGTSDFKQAIDLLRAPLVQAMQLRPSPELIWRRVKAPGRRVGDLPLQVGETVVLSLVSAAQQSLAAGSGDISMIFGGRRSDAQAPTHACPGYAAGIGVLLGVLTGFLTCKERVRPAPVPLAFTIEGSLR
jgi:Dyp-type peroxidase family